MLSSRTIVWLLLTEMILVTAAAAFELTNGVMQATNRQELRLAGMPVGHAASRVLKEEAAASRTPVARTEGG